VRQLPDETRVEFTRRCLRPAAAGWLAPRFANVTVTPRRTITAARAERDRIVLEFDDGHRMFDHVVLGTGYQVDIARLDFLSPRLLEQVARAQGSPLLHRGFESSVPKLHFVGSSAVHSFAPLLRFIAGAPYAARMVANAARRRAARKAAAEFQPAARMLDAAPDLSRLQ
jgi:hypothetical protein